MNDLVQVKEERLPPPIYVTTPEQPDQNIYLNLNQRPTQQRSSHQRSSSLTSLYPSSVHSPLPSSPSTPNFLSDDEGNSTNTRSPISPFPFLMEQQQYNPSFHT
ncbi:hypothetical protein G6F56_013361 [Rhizopus delemar]|nr:hypothetical protein G6F56_013361 [Rhizopus delemar]